MFLPTLEKDRVGKKRRNYLIYFLRNAISLYLERERERERERDVSTNGARASDEAKYFKMKKKNGHLIATFNES